MNFSKYRDQLKQNISELSSPKRLIFAIQVCNRLIPDYQRFVIRKRWGDIFVINQALDYCKRIEKGFEHDREKIRNFIIAVDKNTPDINDFGEVSGSLALKSASVITETLNYILDNEEQRIVDIGLLAYGSVFFKMREKHPDLKDSEIENTKELLEEISWQLKQTSNGG